MKRVIKPLFPFSLLVCTLATTTRVGAQEPVGGQPAPGAKQSVANLDASRLSARIRGGVVGNARLRDLPVSRWVVGATWNG